MAVQGPKKLASRRKQLKNIDIVIKKVNKKIYKQKDDSFSFFLFASCLTGSAAYLCLVVEVVGFFSQ